MTISQQIVQSLRTDSHIAAEEDGEVFDLDDRLRASSKKVLLQRINFVEARQSYHFNLKKLKSKYVILNPNHAASKKTAIMSPALKLNSASVTENTSTNDGIPSPKMTLFFPEKIELAWRKSMRSGAGLCNLGNTCFLNSALQCLSYTAPLANYLVHMDHRKHCKSKGQFCMLCAMQQHLYSVHSNSGQAIKPMFILKNLRMIAKHLQFGRQEDAHEFIRYSVDAMQKSCLVGYPSKMDVHIKTTTVIHQIFGGYLRSRVKCKQCKSVSDTYDPFLDLSLDINKQGCADLQRCLEMFVRIEVLQGDNAYKCIQCKNTVQACKKFSIHRAPNILMIQLKRFSQFMGNKINKELVYPSKLNIGPYMSNKPEGGLWYELYAVLVHSGYSCQSGHYYTYAKAPNDQWYCFNDSSVHQVSVNQALNQQAYLLFYSRNPKATAQLGGLKSINKSVHTFPMNKSQSQQPTCAANRSKMNGNGLLNKANGQSIIGPKLPPNFKRDKDPFAFQSTASSSDTGSPLTKPSNQPKIIKHNPLNKPSGNASRPLLQFTINRKPKQDIGVTIGTNHNQVKKLTNGGPVTPSMTKSQSFNAQNNTQVKTTKPDLKTSTLPANASGSLRSPILDKFLKDSNIAGTSSSSSTNTSHSSLSSSASTSASVGLKAIVSYSSNENDSGSDSDNSPSSSNYSSMTSTLQQLRKESSSTIQKATNSGKKVTVKGTIYLPVGIPQNESTKPEGSSLESTDKKLVENEKKKDDLVTMKASIGVKENSSKQYTKPTNTKKSSPNRVQEVRDTTLKECTEPSPRKEKLVRHDSATEREPILLLLNNEINSASDAEHTKNDDDQAEKSSNFDKKVSNCRDEGKWNGKQEDKSLYNNVKVKESIDTVQRDKDKKKRTGKISNEREIHKSRKERKRHYSSESTSSSTTPTRKRKDDKHKQRERSSSSSPQKICNKTPTPKKKRKKSEHRRHDDYDSSEDSERRKVKHHKAAKRKDEDADISSKKQKKHERKHFYSLKRSHSKSNGRCSDQSDSESTKRSSSLEALYCDKSEYEQSLKRKAKKDKKRRIRERKMLQSSINEQSPETNDLDRSSHSRHHSKERQEKKDRSRESSHSKGSNRDKSRDYDYGDRGKDSRKEKSHKNDRDYESKEKKDTESTNHVETKERPNILAQLLKQSAGKAYGVKVDTWNGGESVVEKDAERTWLENRSSLNDDWDREYDRGKTKKIKKKDQHSKSGPVHNLFQKFQNMKSHRSGS